MGGSACQSRDPNHEPSSAQGWSSLLNDARSGPNEPVNDDHSGSNEPGNDVRSGSNDVESNDVKAAKHTHSHLPHPRSQPRADTGRHLLTCEGCIDVELVVYHRSSPDDLIP